MGFLFDRFIKTMTTNKTDMGSLKIGPKTKLYTWSKPLCFVLNLKNPPHAPGPPILPKTAISAVYIVNRFRGSGVDALVMRVGKIFVFPTGVTFGLILKLPTGLQRA